MLHVSAFHSHFLKWAHLYFRKTLKLHLHLMSYFYFLMVKEKVCLKFRSILQLSWMILSPRRRIRWTRTSGRRGSTLGSGSPDPSRKWPSGSR